MKTEFNLAGATWVEKVASKCFEISRALSGRAVRPSNQLSWAPAGLLGTPTEAGLAAAAAAAAGTAATAPMATTEHSAVRSARSERSDEANLLVERGPAYTAASLT